MQLTFMNPAAFLILLLIPIFYIMKKIGLFTRIYFPLTFSDWKGYVFTWNDRLMKFFSGLCVFLFSVGFICVVVAFAEPVVHHQERVYTSRGTDVLFVLDTSPSMAARDINGLTRIDAAKAAINSIVNANSGGSYGLVAMGSEASIVIPVTNDLASFQERLNDLLLGTMGEGTAIGTGLSCGVYHLAGSKALRKCIILITDGENNAGEIHPETAAKLAKERNITLYTLGIGTRGSVPLDYRDPVTGKEYTGYLDSSFDPTPLEKLAVASGGRYYGVESSAILSASLNAIVKRQSVVQSYYLRTVDDYYYDKFLLVAVIIFGVAWFVRRIVLQEIV